MDNLFMQYVKLLCQKVCANTFGNSEQVCITQHTEEEKTTSTLQQIELQKEIIQYCKTHKNRFWILYYARTENEIDQLCGKCASQQDKCKDYILDRIVKHIKAFNSEQESSVFTALREVLRGEEKPKESIVQHYANKIHRSYLQKNRDIDKSTVLLENALQHCEDERYAKALSPILNTCKTYKNNMSLQEFVKLAFVGDEESEKVFSTHLFNELIELEKFASYMKKIIQSRFIDFTRSKAAELIVSDELEDEQLETESIDEIYDETLLLLLNEEQRIMSKLKYGFRLDNKEFVLVHSRLAYDDIDILTVLTNEEKFYIKLVTKYGLSDNDAQLKHYNIKELQLSIHTKITQLREKLHHHSYREYESNDKKEIFFKLLYAESLSSKEIALIFDMTAKQVDKKIENSKKKLKRNI